MRKLHRSAEFLILQFLCVFLTQQNSPSTLQQLRHLLYNRLQEEPQALGVTFQLAPLPRPRDKHAVVCQFDITTVLYEY